ncbi:hypothetical protein B5V01_01595 [Mesorhizobium erdmanii]|uniref:Uncharacterized protein n=2 Tax=Mesorhizobium TaxID=68287 RepID=A0A3M9XAV9_9HYPH|nr:hypothetical protein DNR46_13970 [Mesorhizobium japonicum]RXT51804.1 hypothetical protein B5V01_01595 [Mesorhizobium erdmanii]
MPSIRPALTCSTPAASSASISRGWTPRRFWRNAVSVIGQCIAEAGIDAGEIVAIGCSGHGRRLPRLTREDIACMARSTRR